MTIFTDKEDLITKFIGDYASECPVYKNNASDVTRENINNWLHVIHGLRLISDNGGIYPGFDSDDFEDLTDELLLNFTESYKFD